MTKNGNVFFHYFREETHLLEIPLEDSPVNITILENKAVSKPIPVLATVRSSKLAAMAANMNKGTDTDPELEIETSGGDMEEDTQENLNLVKLEDILIVPDIINEENLQNIENENNEITEYGENNENVESNGNENTFDLLRKVDDIAKQSDQRITCTNGAEKSVEQENANSDGAGTSSNLSLSCVNLSGIADAAYRLGSM